MRKGAIEAIRAPEEVITTEDQQLFIVFTWHLVFL